MAQLLPLAWRKDIILSYNSNATVICGVVLVAFSFRALGEGQDVESEATLISPGTSLRLIGVEPRSERGITIAPTLM